MKKSLDFSIRYGKADGWMLKLCLLCLICFGGNISLQAKTEGNESVKMLERNDQQKELLLRQEKNLKLKRNKLWMASKKKFQILLLQQVKN